GGLTVTPAAAAAASTVQFTVRGPGPAVAVTFATSTPFGTLATPARTLSRTGCTVTTPSARRFGKMESAARSLKVPLRTPARNVAVAGNAAGLPPVTATSPESTLQFTVRPGTVEFTARFAVAAP